MGRKSARLFHQKNRPDESYALYDGRDVEDVTITESIIDELLRQAEGDCGRSVYVQREESGKAYTGDERRDVVAAKESESVDTDVEAAFVGEELRRELRNQSKKWK